MKFINFFSIILVFSSIQCQKDPVEIQTEIGRLEAKLRDTKKASDSLDIELQNKFHVYEHLKHEVSVLQKVQQGKKLFHIVTIRVKQERRGLDMLDVEAQMKDHFNAFEFDIPVDPVYYGMLNEGDYLVEKFRNGSLLFKGSTSSMTFRVIKKRIEAM